MAEKAKTYHASRFGYLSKYVILFILLAAGTILYGLKYSFFVFASPITIAVVCIIVLEFKVRSNKILIGQENMIVKRGFFSKNSSQINYRSISDMRIKQTALQRMLGYGDIEIGVPGSSLTQNFSGRGDVKVEGFGNSGVVLKKFQKVRSIEYEISSRTSRPSGIS